TAAQKAVGLGRLLAGRKGKITTLPGPLGGWTEARDIPAPPKQTFRQWWNSDEGRAALAQAREKGRQQ
ncbi:lactate utilisation protein LutB domain-containing protein, partial [Rhodococcus sp. YH1]